MIRSGGPCGGGDKRNVIIRCRADRQEDGYFYQGGVLVHSKLADPVREFTRVVVPD